MIVWPTRLSRKSDVFFFSAALITSSFRLTTNTIEEVDAIELNGSEL